MLVPYEANVEQATPDLCACSSKLLLEATLPYFYLRGTWGPGLVRTIQLLCNDLTQIYNTV